MPQAVAIATKLPVGLKSLLDRVCELTGLRKNHIIETALREKLEDLLDAHDLREAMSEAAGFHPWKDVKKQLGLK